MAGGVDEFRLIADLFAPLSRGFPGALGLTDDAAFLAAEPGTELVMTVDAMVAGVHFLPDDPPDLIARKLLRVNLSDLAAKGAAPLAVLMAAAFPKDVDEPWLRAFAAGLAEDLDAFGLPLIGGDTVSTPGPLTLSVTALGRVPAGKGLLRSGAAVGEVVWLSGSLGDGALGLAAAQGLPLAGVDAGGMTFLADRYRLPCPRVSVGPRLVGLARASMDVSDGLVQDLGHLARASRVGAVVEVDRLPLSPAARAALAADDSLLARVLTGGDDYELLFTAPPEAAPALVALTAETGVPLTAIGRIVDGEGVRVLDAAGRTLGLKATGWRHFSGGRE